jgi:DMSO/TMAO reductase YedYZ molybdopterin-dependent catalytic subunit
MVLSVVTQGRLSKSGKFNPVQINRQISWVLVFTSIVNYLSGYGQTILNIKNPVFLLGHQIFGVFFSFLTLFHIFISVFIVRYRWRESINKLRSGEASFLYWLKFIQRVSGWGIIIPAFLVVVSGLDWFKVGTGTIIPFISHIRYDIFLSLSIILHTATGLKFALMRRRQGKKQESDEGHSPARREALTLIRNTILSMVVVSFLDRIPRIDKVTDKIKNILPPNQYEVDTLRVLYVGSIPKFNEETWDFEVYGSVRNPIRLTFDELKELHRTVSTSDFHCVTGWTKFDNKWEGIRFRTLIKIVQPRISAKYVTFECENDYTTSLPLEELEYDDVILAYRLEDKVLPPEHGGPLRLVVPHKYAYKSAKWVRKMKFTEELELGYWEQRGYSNSADPFINQRYSSDDIPDTA